MDHLFVLGLDGLAPGQSDVAEERLRLRSMVRDSGVRFPDLDGALIPDENSNSSKKKNNDRCS